MTTQRSVGLAGCRPAADFKDIRVFERAYAAAFPAGHSVGPKTRGVVIPTPKALRMFARAVTVAGCCLLGVGVLPCSFLGVHVFDVVQRFPHEQMGWIAAGPHIAGVADKFSWGHHQSSNLCGESVRAVQFAFDIQNSVPFSIKAAIPKPTLTGFARSDGSPKSGLDFFCDQWKTVGIHS